MWYIDLVLVSTVVQRLHFSEFEFLFQVCEYFHVARHLFKHWTKIVKSHNKKTTEDFLFLPSTPSSNVLTKPLLAEPSSSEVNSCWKRRWAPPDWLHVVVQPQHFSFLPPSPPRAPPSQVVIVTPSFQSLVDPPFLCVFSRAHNLWNFGCRAITINGIW